MITATILHQQIDGKGAVVVLDNGNGQSTFGLPDRKVTATTTALPRLLWPS